MFSSAFKRTRCIVPASGYCEWRAVNGGKQPYFISAADGSVLAIAGFWDQWNNPYTGDAICSCTLIVTAANDFARHIHDRMPDLVAPRNYEAWLTGKAGVELLRPVPNDLLRMWPVSNGSMCQARETMTRARLSPFEDGAGASDAVRSRLLVLLKTDHVACCGYE